MAKFMFLFRGGDRTNASPAEIQAQMKQWMAWFESLTKQGHYFGAGEPLEVAGKTLSGRAKTLTDGPYAEAKDLVGGYAVVTAESLNQATDLARGCPIFEIGGAVEVRPVRAM